MVRGGSMTGVARFHDWEVRLATFVLSCEKKQFRYGSFDCCLFAADAIRAMTGRDFMERLRIYQDGRGARDLLKELGGIEIALDQVAAENKLHEVPVLKAQRGDLCVYPGKRPAAGILSLDGAWVWIPIRRGLGLVPLNLCRRAWRVG